MWDLRNNGVVVWVTYDMAIIFIIEALISVLLLSAIVCNAVKLFSKYYFAY